MRRLISRLRLAGLLVSLLVLAACTGADTGQNGTPAPDDTGTVGTSPDVLDDADTSTEGATTDEPLQLWVRSGELGLETYEEMVRLYEQETGQEIEVFATGQQFEERLIRAAAGNDLPDMMIYDTASLGQMIDWGLVQEIDRSAVGNADEIIDIAWDAARGADGNYYGVPTSTQAFNLFIRTDWLEELNLDPPESWDDIVSLAIAFTEEDPNNSGQADTAGFMVPASTERGYASWFWQTYLWQAGGDYMEDAGDGTFRPTLDQPEAEVALQWLKDLFWEHQVVQPGAINHTTSEPTLAYRAGEGGMYYTGPYQIAALDDTLGADKYDVFKHPPGPESDDVLAEGENLSILVDTEHYEAALAFAEWVASPVGQEAGMNPDGISVIRLPINRNVDAAEVYDDERWRVVAESFEESGRYVQSVPNWAPFRQLVADYVNRALADEDSDVAAILQEANEAVAAELEAQGVLVEGWGEE